MAEVTARLEQYMNSQSRDVEFRVDHDAGAVVVTVRNASTGDVIRQIPNADALALMRRLNAGSSTVVDAQA